MGRRKMGCGVDDEERVANRKKKQIWKKRFEEKKKLPRHLLKTEIKE
jgi:hypothetical protein